MKRVIVASLIVVALLVALPIAALADGVPNFDFGTPLFGLDTAPDGSLLVADGGSGIVELRNGVGSLVAELPGVADVASIGRGNMFALANGMLYRVSRGNAQAIADLGAFEAEVNPDGGEIDSNPFDVAALNGGTALVADAAGNDLLAIDMRGNVDWIATFPDELVPTDNIQNLIGCPSAPPELAFVCGIPMMPAQAVPTSVAIGPDGAYYVGELKGFPGPLGMSRIWRIQPGTRHAQCGSSPACSVVASGFTSIVDLAFGPDGTLYVVEFDEASFMAVELEFFFGIPGLTQGGTVNACDLSSGTCSVVAGELPLPIAAAAHRDGTLYAAIGSLIPGAAQVITLP